MHIKDPLKTCSLILTVRLKWEFSHLSNALSWTAIEYAWLHPAQELHHSSKKKKRTDASSFLPLTRPDGTQRDGIWSPSFHRAKTGLCDIFHVRHRPRLDAASRIHCKPQASYIYVLNVSSHSNLIAAFPFKKKKKPSHYHCVFLGLCHYSCWHRTESSGMHLQIKPALDKAACQQYGDRGSCVMSTWHWMLSNITSTFS